MNENNLQSFTDSGANIPEENPKNKKLLFGIVGIAVGIIAVAGFLLWQVQGDVAMERPVEEEIVITEQEEPEPQVEEQAAVVEETDTSTWQTYRNDELGFEIKYPLEYFAEIDNDDLLFCFSAAEGAFDPPSLCLSIDEYHGYFSAQEWANRYRTMEYDRQASVEVAGQEAIMFDGSVEGFSVREIVFIRDYRAFYIIMFSSGMRLEDQILSTFRFEEQPQVQPSDLTLLFPNGGEELLAGREYVIRWNSENVDRVNVGLHKGDYFVEELVADVPSALWIWVVPADITSGVDYRIYIESAEKRMWPGGYALDYSDGYFSIVVP